MFYFLYSLNTNYNVDYRQIFVTIISPYRSSIRYRSLSVLSFSSFSATVLSSTRSSRLLAYFSSMLIMESIILTFLWIKDEFKLNALCHNWNRQCVISLVMVWKRSKTRCSNQIMISANDSNQIPELYMFVSWIIWMNNSSNISLRRRLFYSLFYLFLYFIIIFLEM